jgi:hypothetical protein
MISMVYSWGVMIMYLLMADMVRPHFTMKSNSIKKISHTFCDRGHIIVSMVLQQWDDTTHLLSAGKGPMVINNRFCGLWTALHTFYGEANGITVRTITPYIYMRPLTFYNQVDVTQHQHGNLWPGDDVTYGLMAMGGNQRISTGIRNYETISRTGWIHSKKAHG